MKVTIVSGTRGNTYHHVHDPECRDRHQYGFGKAKGGDSFGEQWTIDLVLDEVEGQQDLAFYAARAVYEDHISDYGYEYDSPEAVEYWQGNASDFKVFPCVGRWT